MKLTPWYPPEVKPIRVGLYQIGYPDDPGVALQGDPAYWNGGSWQRKWDRTNLYEQRRPWRGLAEDPNK